MSGSTMQVAIATMTGIPPEFTDDARLADGLAELGVPPITTAIAARAEQSTLSAAS